jgi:hypothetical protein
MHSLHPDQDMDTLANDGVAGVAMFIAQLQIGAD